MIERTTLLALAAAGLCLTAPTARTLAVGPAGPVRLASMTTAVSAEDDDEKKGNDKHAKDDDDHKGEKKEKKETEQEVPMAMVPAAVMDAVKKEVPDGTVTGAELVAKKGKIMYSFDVKSGGTAYEVKVTVDGKFYSKKVDDDADDEGGPDKK